MKNLDLRKKSYPGVTYYGKISGLYFKKILKSIITIGQLKSRKIKILDFGSGYGVLKRMLQSSNANITNYDIEKDLTDVDDWRDIKFDLMIANAVFYSFNPNELINLLKEHNNRLELIVGIGRQSFLNKIGMLVLGKRDAHSKTKLTPQEELKILQTYMHVISHKSVWCLADVYLLKFK